MVVEQRGAGRPVFADKNKKIDGLWLASHLGKKEKPGRVSGLLL